MLDDVAASGSSPQTPRVPNARIPAPDVGARIRERREAMGVSQDELAVRFRRATGSSMTQNTIGRWEAHGRLSVGEARVIAEVLGVSPAWLLLGAEG